MLEKSTLYTFDSHKSLAYSQALIRKASITPKDMGCQTWLAHKLTSLGFECVLFEVEGVSNLIASIGQGTQTIAFAGHTDVVPPGDESKWTVDPFAAEVVGDELIGRGASDMKTGLAAMLAATERVLSSGNALTSRFMWLVTSDEEGEAEFGSAEICRWLERHDIELEMCIVGEPTAKNKTGDSVRVGRRGSLSAKLVVHGIQGHVAYPQYAENAVHKVSQSVQALLALDWDEGSEDFPGSNLQITYVNSGTFTDNIVPARCEVCFNVRYSSHYDEAAILIKIEKKLKEQLHEYELSWERPCDPYLTCDTGQSSLISSIERAIHKNTGSFPLLSTSGGTSDGRFFAQYGAQVVELGVPNKTIHQVNERVALTDLYTLEDIYTDLLTELVLP